MTRRAVSKKIESDAIAYADGKSDFIREKFEYVLKHSLYKVGDVVAIQQAYKDIPIIRLGFSYDRSRLIRSEGWTNKMFVKAKLMPHHVRITDVRVERLQLITYDDCLREGIMQDDEPYRRYYFSLDSWYTSRYIAFATLIDKVSGRGTWDRNPIVWVYSFERVD